MADEAYGDAGVGQTTALRIPRLLLIAKDAVEAVPRVVVGQI